MVLYSDLRHYNYVFTVPCFRICHIDLFYLQWYDHIPQRWWNRNITKPLFNRCMYKLTCTIFVAHMR